ncbi:MAG: hypothetical protein ACTTHG_07475 [Treponemataceae bacterium]
MKKNRSHSNEEKDWKNSRNHNKNSRKKEQEKFSSTVKNESFEKIQLKTVNCSYCNKPIEELANAMASKENGSPVHFDCVLKKIEETEKLGQNEKITYIGGGKFGVVYFENPQDLKNFTIKKVIEWENRDVKYEWRSEISTLFSSIK